MNRELRREISRVQKSALDKERKKQRNENYWTKGKPWRDAKFGEWVRVNFVAEAVRRAEMGLPNPRIPSGLKEFWKNNLYTVQIFHNEIAGYGEVKRLLVRRNDGGVDIPFAHKQSIKNFFAGDDAQAIEVFPPQEDLIDDANCYHLWIIPAGQHLPFNLADVYQEDQVDEFEQFSCLFFEADSDPLSLDPFLELDFRVLDDQIGAPAKAVAIAAQIVAFIANGGSKIKRAIAEVLGDEWVESLSLLRQEYQHGDWSEKFFVCLKTSSGDWVVDGKGDVISVQSHQTSGDCIEIRKAHKLAQLLK